MPFPRLSPEQKAILVEMYLAGITPHAIAESEQLEVAQVIKVLKEQGVNISRSGRYGILDRLSSREVEEIVDAYRGNVVTIVEICARYNLTREQLFRILAVMEVPLRSFSKESLESRKRRLDEAVSMYQQGRKLSQIKVDTGIDDHTLYVELAKRKVVRRRVPP